MSPLPDGRTAPTQVVALSLARARAEVDRLSAGVSRAAMGTPEHRIRAAARSAVAARQRATARRARLTPVPPVELGALDRVEAAGLAHGRAVAAVPAAVDRRQRLIALGNVSAILAVGAGLVQLRLGVPFDSVTIAAPTLLAGVAPFATFMAGTGELRRAKAEAARARSALEEALVGAGVRTLGEAAAVRLRHNEHARRRREVVASADAEVDAMAKWHSIAGPGIDPGEVDRLCGRLAALRQAQLRYLELLLDTELARRQASPVRLVPDPVGDRQDPPPGEPGPGGASDSDAVVDLGGQVRTSTPAWLADTLARLRRSRLATG